MYTIRIHPYLIYIVKQDIHIAGQTAGPIGQKFFVDTHRWLGGVIGLKNNEVLKLMFFFLRLLELLNTPLQICD